MRISSRQFAAILLAGVLGVAVVALIDLFTGAEVRTFPLYLIPVIYVAWYLGSPSALTLALFAALSIAITDRLAGKQYIQPLAEYWNIFAEYVTFSVTAHLIARQAQQRREAERLAGADPLTGAKNRRAFYEIVNAEIRRARRYAHTLTLAYLDLDDFKTLNDSLGHRVGDEALLTLVEAVQSTIRDVDTLGRIGGDEFSILLPETSAEEAQAVLERLVLHAGSEFRRRAWPLTVSCGAVAFVDLPASAEELIDYADRCMYDAKRSGKNAVRVRIQDSPKSP